MTNRRHVLTAGAAVVLALYSAEASAQVVSAAPPSAPETTDGGEIVVTGTSIRGLVAPVGASTVTVSRDEVKATGATSAVDLLASIPQIRGFGTTPAGAASATQSFSIPTLRVLPNTQPGDGTLFLWNGNRMVGGGFNTRPDPAVVPPGSIDHVEVVLGGGSAIYGSDAVAGTINFMVRKTLDGLETRGTYGFADHYSTFDLSAAWGKVWDTGNILISVDGAGHSDVLGRYRGYYTNNNTANGGTDFRQTSCGVPNVTVGSTVYAYPALLPNTRNLCDPTDNTDLYPRERRWSVLGSFNQELTDSLEFGIDAYYSRRTDWFLTQQTAITGTIKSTNPYFVAPPSAPATTSEKVGFNFSSVFGDSLTTDQQFTTYQIIPSVKWKIGGDWRAVASLNYGYGDGAVHAGDVDPVLYAAALAGMSATTALNPFNLSQTNASVLAGIRNYDKYDFRSHKMLETKVVVDGTLVNLPGGAAKLAVGGERYWESQYSLSAAGAYGAEDPARSGGLAAGNREVWSGFAELVVPVFGPENAIPGFDSLTFDASGRYDHYSDFGGTWNPRIAGTWKPIPDIAIRADYSTAFVAASLNSTTKPQVVQVSATTSSALVPTGGSANLPQITIQGGNPNLKPETAKIYDIGMDLAPRFAPGFRASLTYYHIDMSNVIAGPNTSLFFSNPGYSRFYLLRPTSLDQVKAFQNLGSIPVQGGGALDQFGLPQIVVDSRTANLGRVVTSGLDYSVQYRFETGIGTFTPAIAGTHALRVDSATPDTAPFVDSLANGVPSDTFTASLNYASGPVNARATWDYLGGFPVQNITNQTYVKSFQTANLYLSYKLPAVGALSGTTLSLHLDNVFDTAPSYENLAGGTGNGSTFGRFFSVSLEKKF